MPTKTLTFAPDPFTRDELIHAALMGNMEEIDKITDRLVEQGMCRMTEWIARRPVAGTSAFPLTEAAVDAAAESSIGSQLAAHFRGAFAGVAQ